MRWARLVWGTAAALAVLAALVVAAQTEGVRVVLGDVTKREVTLQVTKTNSNTTRVISNLTRAADGSDFQQISTEFNSSIPVETRQIVFSNLTVDQEYRACSSESDASDTVSDVGCFKFRTFSERSASKGVVAAVIAACVFIAVVALLYIGYRAVRRRKHSQTMVVNSNGRSHGVENAAAEIPAA